MEANVDNLLMDAQADVAEPVESNDSPVEENNDAVQESQEAHEESPIEEGQQEEVAQAKSEDDFEDYGDITDDNDEPVYSKAKLQEIVQDRLKRERARYERMMQEMKVQQSPQEVEQAQYDPYVADNQQQGNEDWEAQLDTLLEQRMQKIEEKKMQEAVRAREEREQAEYAQKFEAGMSRYNDFQDVVDPYSMSDHMMMATRSLKNPAAFIYSANKHHGEELNRIRELPPTQQMVEIGRLEERMRRQRSSQSKAPAPITPDRGDVKAKSFEASNNVDQLLMRDQNERMKRNRNR